MATRVTFKLIGALSLGSALLAGACGGKSSGGDDDEQGPITEAYFRQTFPSYLCSLISGCCDRAGAPISESNCQAQASEAVVDLAADGALYDGAAASACLNGYAAAFARCVLPSEAQIEACDSIYTGTTAIGQPCLDSDECVDGSYCDFDATGTSTVCVSSGSAAPRGSEGEACSASCASYSDEEPCFGVSPAMPGAAACYAEDGLECDYLTFTCVRLPAVGEPCPNYTCVPGAYCDFAATQCAAALPDGASCIESTECQSFECNNGICGAEVTLDAEFCTEF